MTPTFEPAAIDVHHDVLQGLFRERKGLRDLAPLREVHIEVAWTPTEASWLNLIDRTSGVLKRATISGRDDRATSCAGAASYRNLRWRDRRRGRVAIHCSGSAPFVLISWNGTRRTTQSPLARRGSSARVAGVGVS